MSNLKYYILFIVAFSLSGCLKDKGNYEYTALPPVDIAGLKAEYRVFLQTPFEIKPQLSTDIPDDLLEYRWMMAGDTISNKKDLQYTFTSQATKVYNLIFEVYDKQRKVRYSSNTSLAIVSPYQTGWAVLSEASDQSVLNFLSYEGEGLLYKDVYKTTNQENLGRGAVSVKQLVAYDVDRISVLIKDGKSVELDGSTFAKVKYYNDEFQGGINFSPKGSNVEYFSADRFIMFTNADGLAYNKSVGSSSVDDGWYASPIPGDALGYSLGPWSAKSDLIDYYVTYDEKNGRYLRFIRKSLSQPLSPLILDSRKPAAFDPSSMPGKSVWMGVNNTKRVISVLKKPDGQYVLHILNSVFDESYRERWVAEAAYTFPNGIVQEGSCFTTHKTSPYLYVGTGKDLYIVNLAALGDGASAVHLLQSYEANITAVEHAFKDLNGVYFNELAIALDTQLPDGDRGSLLFLETALNANGSIIKRVDGLGGKVVSMVRKVQP